MVVMYHLSKQDVLRVKKPWVGTESFLSQHKVHEMKICSCLLQMFFTKVFGIL